MRGAPAASSRLVNKIRPNFQGRKFSSTSHTLPHHLSRTHATRVFRSSWQSSRWSNLILRSLAGLSRGVLATPRNMRETCRTGAGPRNPPLRIETQRCRREAANSYIRAASEADGEATGSVNRRAAAPSGLAAVLKLLFRLARPAVNEKPRVLQARHPLPQMKNLPA